MPKKILYCESCMKEYTISYKGKDDPVVCPFCGDEVDLDWNSDDDADE